VVEAIRVADSIRTRLSSSAAGPAQNQHAVLMKSDLDLSGIHMLSWVLIINGGRGERARIGTWSTDKRARLSPQDNKQHLWCRDSAEIRHLSHDELWT
jgi:hypothetical protein